jgi:leucyl-tRNA synthetase
MAVPAHDERDYEFAKKYGLEIKYVLEKPSDFEDGCYANRGVLIDSGEWSGLNGDKDLGKILDWIEKKGIGNRETSYHLRDWLISRQRYWGAPIPMIKCEKDGWIPVEEKDLPVLLPLYNYLPVTMP